ncbi:MAG TPA: hypothetical protein VEP90_13205 [Methylomirabilota bacterium]|nr:hypothetical protein [Methylomirabilota bacterium]
MKLTFVQIDEEVVLVESFQNASDMLLVFFEGIRVDEDIIQKCNIDLIDKTFQVLIDDCMEGRWCVRKIQRQDHIFEMAVFASEGCFPFIFFFNPHRRMISFFQIDLNKEPSLQQSVKHLVN